MKRLIVLAALGLFLVAHSVITVATIFPQPALADCTGQGCNN